MKFVQLSSGRWINLHQVLWVNQDRGVMEIAFSDGSKLEEHDPNFAEIIKMAMEDQPE